MPFALVLAYVLDLRPVINPVSAALLIARVLATAGKLALTIGHPIRNQKD